MSVDHSCNDMDVGAPFPGRAQVQEKVSEDGVIVFSSPERAALEPFLKGIDDVLDKNLSETEVPSQRELSPNCMNRELSP